MAADGAVGFGVDVGIGEVLGDGVVVGDDFATGLTATPLFQTSLCPDLTQVYLIFEIVFVELSLVHLVPAMDAEYAGSVKIRKKALSKKVTSGNLVLTMWRD